jgi:ubiquitin-like-conjugating enzyme ATG10
MDESVILPEDVEYSKLTPATVHAKVDIVWHPSYQVPVLCFSLTSAEGHPLNRAQTLTALGMTDDADSWDFLSSEEHPVTGTPTFLLHPCRTQERMHLLVQEAAEGYSYDTLYLQKWLCMVGPQLKIRVSPHTFVRAQAELGDMTTATALR